METSWGNYQYPFSLHRAFVRYNNQMSKESLTGGEFVTLEEACAWRAEFSSACMYNPNEVLFGSEDEIYLVKRCKDAYQLLAQVEDYNAYQEKEVYWRLLLEGSKSEVLDAIPNAYELLRLSLTKYRTV